MPNIGDIAIEAARAMDVGDYRKVRRLFDELIEDGVPEEEVRQAFREEGADIDNLPTVFGQGNYMLHATKDTVSGETPIRACSI